MKRKRSGRGRVRERGKEWLRRGKEEEEKLRAGKLRRTV